MVRFKRRYFCVEVMFQEADLSSSAKRIKLDKIKHTSLTETIHKSIERFYGDLGMATMMPSFSVIYFNMITNLAIMRTARNLQDKFHNLLTFINKIDDFDVSFRVVHVSGSIKKCKKYLLEYCNQRLAELNSNELYWLDKHKSTRQEEKAETSQVLERIATACKENDNILNLN